MPSQLGADDFVLSVFPLYRPGFFVVRCKHLDHAALWRGLCKHPLASFLLFFTAQCVHRHHKHGAPCSCPARFAYPWPHPAQQPLMPSVCNFANCQSNPQDVGAADGIHLSNTEKLERAGWRGIAVDPLAHNFEERPATACVKAALYSQVCPPSPPKHTQTHTQSHCWLFISLHVCSCVYVRARARGGGEENSARAPSLCTPAVECKLCVCLHGEMRDHEPVCCEPGRNFRPPHSSSPLGKLVITLGNVDGHGHTRLAGGHGGRVCSVCSRHELQRCR